MAEEDDDDLDFGDLRSVFKSMRESDEEPPASGMAALMAAAHAKADEIRPRPSWWQRFTATLMRPPALAFATVVVLVGGGAVLFNHRSAMKETAPAPASSAVVSQGSAAPAPPAEWGKDEPDKDTKGEGASEELQVAPGAYAPETPTAKVSAPKKDGAKIALKSDAKVDPKGHWRGDLDRAPRAQTVTQTPATEPAPAQTEGTSRAIGGQDEERDDVSSNAHGNVRGPAPAQIAAPADAPVLAAREEAAPPPVPRKQPVAQSSSKENIAELVKRWIAAAAAKNCTLANGYARTIAASDRHAYDEALKKNKTLQMCVESTAAAPTADQ